MTVQVQDSAPQLAQADYWRSLIYDVYNGRGWGASEIVNMSYRSGEEINLQDSDNARIVRQTVTEVKQLGPLVFAAGEVLTFDQPFEVAWHEPLELEQDVFAIRTLSDVYTVDSILPFYGKDRLRETPAQYPDWVLSRYLDIPDTVPKRVISLAQDLIADAVTPYDKARALESYLRTFEYTLDVPPPPTDRDISDYFLFDLQRGYCDYYATSMVVMARSVGIPARLAVGFASGTFDAANERYFVAAKNAHSWVEVFFPNIGWVAFEPTAGLAPIERPSDTSELVLDPNINLDRLAPPWKQIAWGVVLFIVTASGLGFGIWGLRWLTEPLRLKKLPTDVYFRKIFQKIYKYGQLLEVRVPPGSTANEFHISLYARIEGFAFPAGGRSNFIRNALEALEQLSHLYVLSQYSEQPPNEKARRAALMFGRQLQGQLIVISLWSRIQIYRNKLIDLSTGFLDTAQNPDRRRAKIDGSGAAKDLR